VMLVEQRTALRCRPRDVERILHHAGYLRRRLRALAGETARSARSAPRSPGGSAVDRLIAWCKERFDLIVGLVDGASASGFIVALAA
jgi:hypothetical protein